MNTTLKSRAALRAPAATAIALALMSAPAMATTGYFANGTSTQSKGMAGAGTAIGTGLMGAAQNPAMALRYPNQGDACLSLFSPRRSVTIGGAGPMTPGTHESENEAFLVPCGGVNFRIGDRATLGVLMYGNGGMNTEYNTNFFAGFGAGTSPLGVNLEQLFIAVNYAYEVNENVAVGIAPVFAAQRFSATGLEAFQGFTLPTRALLVTGNGDDWSTGIGLNLGATFNASPNLTFGVAYRTKIDMDPFGSYSGLFAEDGDFDIPASASVGVAFTPPSNSGLTLTAEWQRIFYSDVASIANPGPVPPATGFPLGTAAGAGFGWKDMDVFRIGAEYQLNPKWTVRGGLAYNTDFTDGSQVLLNTLAPATPKMHASVGATMNIDDRRQLHIAYTHAFDESLSGNAPLPFGGQPVSMQMSQHELSVGMTWKW
ncbi:OmpP1/FadL family transporter [Marimonas lutisalis]|uniref:OmpP1/FadL family transporter n=1 Tax=Marimonas lutisalis TaxID=2545756 RepID=UPI0010F9A8B4|nr:outer membrane protein transport protein [Marimonas lutisalis]